MTSESSFYKRFAKVLDPNLASTFLRDTGRQFFTNLLSFPFFSIKVITACFCEFDSLLYSKAWFRLSTTNFRSKGQKAKKNSPVKPSLPGDLIFFGRSAIHCSIHYTQGYPRKRSSSSPLNMENR